MKAFFRISFLAAALASLAMESKAGSVVMLGPDPVLEEMKCFQKLISTEPGTKAHEAARIEYLMERLGASKFEFIRNQGVHSSRVAVMHMRYKMMRYPAATAEDFVENIASRSNKTVEPYRMRTPEGAMYLSCDILNHELAVLDVKLKLARGRAEASGQMPPPERFHSSAGLEADSVKKVSSSVENNMHSNKLGQA